MDRGGRADEMMVTDASKLQSSTEHTLGSLCVHKTLVGDEMMMTDEARGWSAQRGEG